MSTLSTWWGRFVFPTCFQGACNFGNQHGAAAHQVPEAPSGSYAQVPEGCCKEPSASRLPSDEQQVLDSTSRIGTCFGVFGEVNHMVSPTPNSLPRAWTCHCYRLFLDRCCAEGRGFSAKPGVAKGQANCSQYVNVFVSFNFNASLPHTTPIVSLKIGCLYSVCLLPGVHATAHSEKGQTRCIVACPDAQGRI